MLHGVHCPLRPCQVYQQGSEAIGAHVQRMTEARCSAERLELAQRYCSNPQSVAVLQRQHLFSVYLHPLPDFGSFPEESIFRGREIQERIQVCDSLHPSDRARALMWGGYPNCDYTRLDAYHRSLAGSKTRPGMLLEFILHPGLPVCRSPLLCLRHCLLSN